MSETSNAINQGTVLRGESFLYKIIKVLGQGSFGITYLATTKISNQGSLGKMEVETMVAVKEFFMNEINTRNDDGSSVDGSAGNVFGNYRRKFRREAENLAKLDHNNIVKVYDVFDANNTTYYVMDYIEGESLDDYILRKGHLSEEETLAVTKEIASAVEYMHSKKMLHLDIKPKNIMRRKEGHYTLIDFGLSKQFEENGDPETSTTIGLGTPGYAPLEQAEYRREGIFPATLDIYALGATMYKMLIGVRPPKATTIFEEGFPLQDFLPFGISKETIEYVARLMSPNRKDRPQTVSEAINLLTDNESTTIVPTSPDPEVIAIKRAGSSSAEKPVPLTSSSQRNNGSKQKNWKRIGIYAAVVTILVIIGLLVTNFFSGKEESQSGNLTEQGFSESDSSAQLDGYGSENGHEWVDLGLPSGIKWATCNIGATSPEDYGDYFAWGEISPKSIYSEENSNTHDKSDSWLLDNGFLGTRRTLAMNHDAARSNWGGRWRMPTKGEIEELKSNTTFEWASEGGINGCLVTSKKNGRSIFLPAAGYFDGDDAYKKDVYGYYWSSTSHEISSCRAYVLYFYSGNIGTVWSQRYIGQSVRAVVETE